MKKKKIIKKLLETSWKKAIEKRITEATRKATKEEVEKLDRCVEKVKEKGGVESPWAVCLKSLKMKRGKGNTWLKIEQSINKLSKLIEQDVEAESGITLEELYQSSKNHIDFIHKARKKGYKPHQISKFLSQRKKKKICACKERLKERKEDYDLLEELWYYRSSLDDFIRSAKEEDFDIEEVYDFLRTKARYPITKRELLDYWEEL